MAEKILQTRIINKHAELGTWNTSELVLKEGEIALAKVMVPQPDGTVAPTFVAKIGNGATFANSPWLFAKASDVYSWAKKETLEYDALPATLKQEIDDLQAAVGGEGTVASMIQTAIEALDVDESKDTDETNGGVVISSIKEVDGKISVTRRALTNADIADLNIAMSKVTGLSDALALKADKTYVDQQDNDIKATIGSTEDAAGAATVYGAIATAKKAGDDAQNYIEAYEIANDARVKTIEDDYTTAAQAGTIAQGKVDTFNTTVVTPLTERVTNAETAITNLKGGDTTATVKANAEAIEKLAKDIGNVANVMNFVGVSTTDPVGTAEVPGVVTIDGEKYTGVAGDVIIFGEAEYVFDDSKWVKFGDASDNAAAISDLQGRVGTIETRLNTGDIKEAITAAQSQADKGVADAKTANEAIAVINGSGDGSIAKAVADEAKLRSDADTAINNKIGGSFDATNTVAKAIGAAAEAASAAQTAIDTHMSDETAHTKAQVGLGNVDNKSVAEIKTEFTGAVADGDDKFVTGDAVYDAIEAAKSAAATTAQEKVDALADNAVKTNTQNISNNAADISDIKNNYARVKGDKLVYGQGDAEMVIVFDCGGAE